MINSIFWNWLVMMPVSSIKNNNFRQEFNQASMKREKVSDSWCGQGYRDVVVGLTLGSQW